VANGPNIFQMLLVLSLRIVQLRLVNFLSLKEYERMDVVNK